LGKSMINNDRRNFIFKSTMLAASGVLTACGGGGGDGAAAAGAEPALAGAAPDPANAVDPAPVETAAVVVIGPLLAGATIRLSASSAVKSAPYCLGYAFRRGDVPAGKVLVGDTGKTQVIPKNVWPDGSLKFAVISGHADVTAAAETNVGLVLVAAPVTPPSQLSTAKLRATEIVAAVGCGAYGTVNWTGADWDAPFQTWVQGPVMSSWIYRKPVGTDPHLVAWLEVRLWASGAVEVLPWIENGYLRVAAPSNKSATFTFTLGKTQRMSAAIDLKHHQRTPLINGTALSYWLASDPGVIARHNTAYLQATELVPSYQAKVDASALAVIRLPTTYLPLQAGSFNFDGDSMASPGYQDPIGLLPQHDVLYLTSDAKIAHAGVIRNGFSAGRYGLHYRDETTNRPLRFSSYPTLNIGDNQGFRDNGGSTTGSYTPAPTGGNGPGWDVAHSPSVGYMAYLVTGRWYFMEEVQFATTANYLGNGDNQYLRVGSKGLVQPATGAWQTRSCAWDWRARVQALCVTPDADVALRSEFIASVEANVEYFHSKYVAQRNNPFGWIKPGESYDNTLRPGAPWQQDFVTAAFGYSVSLGLPISTAATSKLAAFFQWKARSAVMRLGPKGGFWYVNGAPYTVMITPSNAPNYDNGTGPWYESEAAVYNATFAVAPAWLGKVDGTLAGEIMPGADAMWGNLIPAIAYAVRHNVPGAQEAYSRIQSASNWPALSMAFNARPVWSVKPADGTLVMPPVVVAPAPQNSGAPVWAANAPLNAWMEIPGTSGAGGTTVDSYSGWAKLPNGKLAIALAGGHGDGTKNNVAVINLLDNAPGWVEVSPQSPTHTNETAYQPDGKPTTSHTYYSTMWVPATNRLMRIGAKYVSGGGGTSFGTVDGFSLDTNTWDRAGTYGDISVGEVGTHYNPVTNKVLLAGGSRYYDPVTGAVTNIVTGGISMPRAPWAWDSTRNQFFGMCFGDNQEYSLSLGIVAVKVSGNLATPVTIADSSAKAQFAIDIPFYAAMEYDPLNDCFLFYTGSRVGSVGRVYKVTPNNTSVWDMSIFQYGRGGVTPLQTVASGIMNKFTYVPELKGIVMMTAPSANLYFMRLA
jgi:hypothetical protein